MIVSAPDDGTLEPWRVWGSQVLPNSNSKFIYKAILIQVMHALLIILFIFRADTIFETCDIVVLAVKPTLFPVIVRELQVCNGPANQLVLSVMSGITICDIEKVMFSFIHCLLL